MSANKIDARQSRLAAAQAMIGSAASDTLDTIFPKINDELAKLFEDRNIFLENGGIITWTGTQIQFGENLNLVLNQKISGAAPQVISLGSANVNLNNNEMWYAVINRTAGTAVMAIATSLPAVVAANQEVFLIAKRVDAGDGTQRLYWRNGMALNAGQTVRLGASGSGSGGARLEDLDSLLFRASFEDVFDDGPTSSLSAVDVTAAHTDSAAYNAAKGMYTLNYDAGKTIAAGTTTTNINISAVAAFTVKTGDMVINNSVACRITAVASQSSFTTEAFPVAPTLASQVTVSQAVHTKDIYNLPVDGNAISAAFPASTFSEILTDYEDTTAANDNIFDVDVAPVIGYTASPDGTTYTLEQVRPTLETDTLNSVILPSAGSALYFRFFAHKSSGSGIVNLLRYKTFVQKALASGAVAGGVTNSSYAVTNNVGTPINCTLSVVGGKTTITLNWSYAVGVYAGTTASSIEVWLNGQKLPRFVNSTLTPDGSFTETSANIVTLDRDYSALNLSVEIFQRTFVVDNSNTNVTNISYHNEVFQNGFQGFVNQNQLLNAVSTTGTPAAGAFYSQVVGRSAVIDFSQDLKPRMGIERVTTQQVYQLQNEFGPNGEPVYGVLNDNFNQVRAVGSGIQAYQSASGVAVAGSVVGDFFEITFYGTGLNLLTFPGTGEPVVSASVDGVLSTANIYLTNYSTTLQRGYTPNMVLSVVSGLALGIHTVTLKITTAAGLFLNMNAFEIVNESSLVKINPGVSYVNGSKLTLPAQSTFSYSAPVTGTRGGRVLVYQKSDSTIGQSFTAVGSQLNLTAADHTNEEVARTYNLAEFSGGNRSDDFNFVNGNSETDRSFTLEDGTTTLIGKGVQMLNTTAPVSWSIGGSTLNLFLELIFVGTGCDFNAFDTGTSLETFTVTVDGTSIGTLSSIGTANVVRTRKLVSGLPYGTHCVKIQRTAAAGGATPRFINFTVYQPKKPTLPSGAVELADYNVMANFVAGTTAGIDTIATGVLRKSFATREAAFVGTWSATLNVSSYPGGWNQTGATGGNYVEYVFFGTGFEYRAFASTVNATFTIDGATNFTVANGSPTYGAGWSAALTTSQYGHTSFTASTGVLVDSALANSGAGVSISGLTLGLHKVRVAYNSGTNLNAESFDIITPIHSYKSNLYMDVLNTLPVGSCGISDSRQSSPVKGLLPVTKAWSKSIGIAAATTTSTSLIPIPDMTCSINVTTGTALDISFWCTFTTNNNNVGDLLIYVDGQAIDALVQLGLGGDIRFEVSTNTRIAVSKGFHKIDAYWSTGTGTLTAFQNRRVLLVKEV